jgi:phosphomevalonate kinase
MVKVSAPGKICIAGEWAVLKKGNPAIVAAINKRIYAETEESRDGFFYISIKDFGIKKLKASLRGGKLVFVKKLSEEEKKNLLFIKSSIEAAVKYLDKVQPFHITTWSEKVISKIKKEEVSVSIGSSAASVVSIIGSLLKFHGKDIERKDSKGKIYKLAAIAHYLGQGKIGSGFDIASSTFGGFIAYKRFDPEWLLKQLRKNKDLSEVVGMRWPELLIEPLYVPEGMNLLVGWTGFPSSTPKMVKKMNQWRDNNKKDYVRIFNKIGDLVEELIEVWKEEDKDKILKLIKKNRIYLRELGESSGINIETKELRELSDIVDSYGGAGKLSGAGGGDCGFAITFNQESIIKIAKAWEKSNITPINIQLSKEGIKKEF